MERQLDGRSAIVTGSTSGIGLAIGLLFARHGARVLLNGFGKPEEIEAAKAALAAVGPAPLYHPADMSKPEEIRAMCAAAEEAFGAVDILVDNAGIQHVAPVEEFPEARWDAILAINLSSNFHAIKAVLPGMKRRGFGRIINIASAHGLIASPFKAAYVAAKHGVVGLTKTVALEVARTGITCNVICPGFVRTPLAEAQLGPLAEKHGVTIEQALTEYLLDRQPSKRWVEVEEVANMALYLCSPLAASVNGAALSIDGGWVAT